MINIALFWSILANLHPCNYDHPNRISKTRQCFTELNIDGLEFTNGFKCSDVQKFEKLNKLSNNKIELNFYQDQNKWKPIVIFFVISKSESDRVFDLLIYKKLLCSY